MYTDFYKLKEKPFNLTPSPRFLYLGKEHKEALALLSYGVTERKGFILLTGDIGTGKTTMIQALLSNLDNNVQYVHLSNPLLSPKEFMDYLAFSVFKKKVHYKSKTDFLIEFEEFLCQCLQHQKAFILIVDEAQNLSYDLLEEIRLLSNMEFADEKLINIFLIGQPELNEKLNEQRCMPVLQRISSRYHIPPLDLIDTGDYIATRLRIAGAENGNDIISKNSVKAIYQYSRGYPRLINVLADNALLLGYSKGKRKITTSLVRQCYKDMSLDYSFAESSQPESDQDQIETEGALHSGRYWKWGVILVFIILIMAVGMNPRGWNIINKVSKLIPVFNQELIEEVSQKQVTVKKGMNQSKKHVVSKIKIEEQIIPAVQKDEKDSEPMNMEQLEGSKKSEKPFPGEEQKSFKPVIVKEGDTLTILAIDIYGKVNRDIFELIQKYNPEIKDINRINIDQEILFPALSESDGVQTFTVHIASLKTLEFALNQFQKLMKEGYEVYIIPVSDDRIGKLFRITLGNFMSRQEAGNYASAVLRDGISDYAETIQLDSK